jgi:integrase/recombinase XerD
MNLPTVTLKIARHNDKEIVQLHFEKSEKLLQLLRNNKNLRWSQTMKCWYLPFDKNTKQDIFQLLKGSAFINYNEFKPELVCEETRSSQKQIALKPQQFEVRSIKKLDELSEEGVKKVEEFKKWLSSKRYSENTIGTYTDALKTFLRFYANKSIAEINNNDVIIFNNDYILKNSFSASFQNQVVNAIKLFFRTIELKSMETELVHRPKREHVLPNVLSKEEIKLILNAHNNIKHKTMLSLVYSCGLRRSELLNLKLSDIDSKRGLIIIRQAKGKKDRIVPLSNKILQLLRDYFVACKPKQWLFEGQQGSCKYDERSLASVLKLALEKSKINKAVTLHWLRHSYATHLLENGTDLRYIQEILGHSRSTTTEIYTHVSTKGIQNVISPFDTL